MGRGTDSNLYNLVGWVLLLPHFMDGKTEAQARELSSCVRQPPQVQPGLCGLEAGSASGMGLFPREDPEVHFACKKPPPHAETPPRRTASASGTM